MNNEKKNRNYRLLRRVIAGLLSLVILSVSGVLIYTSFYYHADASVVTFAMESDESVDVRQVSNGWLYDGPGEGTCIVFYPGAKVEATSYGALMKRIAESGTDCVLVKMPLNMAFMDMNAMDEVRSELNYDHWYIAGHSLGGAMAGIYANSHLDSLDGIIFLASFSTKPLQRNGFKALSIYGSEDHVLKMKSYEKNKSNEPTDFTECVIVGGNHGQFGYYGQQKGDGEALISAEEQQRQTVEAIRSFLL